MSPLGPFTRVGAGRGRRRGRPDPNQAAIVAALRAAGCSVEILADVGRGVPDLLVGIGGRAGRLALLEIKSPRRGRGKRGVGGGGNRAQIDLNDRERDWHERWRGPVAVVATVEEALAACGLGAPCGQSLPAWVAERKAKLAAEEAADPLAAFGERYDRFRAEVNAELARGDMAEVQLGPRSWSRLDRSRSRA